MARQLNIEWNSLKLFLSITIHSTCWNFGAIRDGRGLNLKGSVVKKLELMFGLGCVDEILHQWTSFTRKLWYTKTLGWFLEWEDKVWLMKTTLVDQTNSEIKFTVIGMKQSLLPCFDAKHHIKYWCFLYLLSGVRHYFWWAFFAFHTILLTRVLISL